MRHTTTLILLTLTTSLLAAEPQSLLHQIALEREGFSPGLIDGKPGQKTTIATADFQRVRGLKPTGQLDAPTAAALKLDSLSPITTYRLTDQDLSYITGPTPKSWLIKSQMDYLGYANLDEAMAEKFHTSRDVIASLNHGSLAGHKKPGDSITIPNIQRSALPPIHHLEVNLTQKIIRGYTSTGQLACLFHCSIAKDQAKRPTGQAHVSAVAMQPVYRFDPKMWPEVKTIHEKLMIPPGPRNPVGLCWIQLSLPGYGMHGTPNPELIGKTGSHGCFRLTNWDAIRLGKAIRAGADVKFVTAAAATI